MASRTEIAASSREHDAHMLDEAARVVRRRLAQPGGIPTAKFCRVLTAEAVALRAEARAIRESAEP